MSDQHTNGALPAEITVTNEDILLIELQPDDRAFINHPGVKPRLFASADAARAWAAEEHPERIIGEVIKSGHIGPGRGWDLVKALGLKRFPSLEEARQLAEARPDEVRVEIGGFSAPYLIRMEDTTIFGFPEVPAFRSLFQVTDPETGCVVFEVGITHGRPLMRLSDAAGKPWLTVGPYDPEKVGAAYDAPCIHLLNPHTGTPSVEIGMLGDDGLNTGYLNLMNAEGVTAANLEAWCEGGALHLNRTSGGAEEPCVQLVVDPRRGGELGLSGSNNGGSLRVGLE